MELIQLQAFVNLAQTQKMSQTAQEMNTSVSQISKLISSLEAELGLSLFDRVGRGLQVNENGKMFYRYASDAIVSLQNGRTALRSSGASVAGCVKIGCYAFSIFLHDCIEAFSRLNPMVDFYFTEIQNEDRRVLMNSTDIILYSGSGSYPGFQKCFPVSHVLKEEPFYAVVSPRLHQFPAQQTSVSLSALQGLPLVENQTSPFYTHPLYTGFSRVANVWGHSFQIRYSVTDFSSKLSIVDHGLAFAFLPEICLETAKKLSPDLQVLSIVPQAPRRSLMIARQPESQMPHSAWAFWQYLRNYYHLGKDCE